MSNQVSVSAELYRNLSIKYEKARQQWQCTIVAELAKHIPFNFLRLIPQYLHLELLVVFTRVNNATDTDVIRNARIFLEKFDDANKEFIDWFADKLKDILKDDTYL